MNFIINLFFVLLQGNSAISKHVFISGPKYFKQNSTMTIACDSERVPIGLSAEFSVNGKAYASIQYFKEKCYVGSDICFDDICQCSNDGKSYSIQFKDTNEKRTHFNFTCSMTFDINGLLEVEDSYLAEIVEVEGPVINSASTLPLNAGYETFMCCSVVTTLQHYNLTFECMNTTSQQLNKSGTKGYVKVISLVKVVYSFSPCRCIFEWDKFVAETEMQLNIQRFPILQMNEKVPCVSSAVLSCTIKDNVDSYGFLDWIHTLHGNFIRYLKPNVKGKMAYITITSCLLQNSGIYTCAVWTKNHENVTFTNKTTELSIRGPPEIVRTKVDYKNRTTMSALVYSENKLISTYWVSESAVIPNTTYSVQTVSTLYKEFSVYGMKYKFLLHEVNLTFTKAASNSYSLSLQNEFGITEYRFQLKIRNADFEKQIMAWVLILTSVGVITMSAIAMLYRRHHIGSFERDVMYDGVNRNNTNMQQYDSSDNHYDDYIENQPTNDYLEVVNDSEKSVSVEEGLVETPIYEEIA